MKKWKAALVLICLFVIGGVAGGAVGFRVGTERTRKAAEIAAKAHGASKRPVDDWIKRRIKSFKTQLNVTSEQQAQIEPLLREAQAELRRLRDASFHQTAEATDRLDAQIMTLLDDKQKIVFARMIKERQQQVKKAVAERAAARERGDGPPDAERKHRSPRD